jgi:hypothetical protein
VRQRRSDLVPRSYVQVKVIIIIIIIIITYWGARAINPHYHPSLPWSGTPLLPADRRGAPQPEEPSYQQAKQDWAADAAEWERLPPEHEGLVATSLQQVAEQAATIAEQAATIAEQAATIGVLRAMIGH